MHGWLTTTFFVLVAGLNLGLGHVFPTGQTFEYLYKTVVLSGSPEIASQFAALGLQCEVKVISVTDTKLAIQITDVKVGKGNEKFTQISPDEIPLRYSASSAYDGNLTKPFAVNFDSKGLIEKLECASDDSEWSINFKIGLASFFEIQKVSGLNSNSDKYIRGNDHQHVGTGTVLETIEPTFAGNCKTIYDYRPKWTPSDTPRAMEITRTRDYRTCIDEPYFAMSTHRAFKCDSCDADVSHPLSRNTVYRYETEIDTRGNYIIKNAICDGVVRFAPIGQQADALTVIHNQTLELMQLKNEQQSIPLTSNSKTVKPFSNLFDKLAAMRKTTDLNRPIIYEQLMGGRSYHWEARNLIKKTAKLMAEDPTADEYKVIIAAISNIQLALFTVPYHELQVLAEGFSGISSNESRIARKLFYESVALTATNPCVKLILEASMKKWINAYETADLLPTVAGHVANPNVLLMDKFMEFCQSEDVKQHKQLYVTCVINFGSLVAKTCAEKKYQLPSAPQNFCPREKLQHYVSTMENELEHSNSEEKTAALITCLSNMAVKEVKSILWRYAWNNARTAATKMIQIKAIYGLIPLAMQNPELVQDSLVSLIFDSRKDTEVRTSAFRALMVTRPSWRIYEQIGMLTKYDDDQALCVCIYTVFRALANSTHACLSDASGHAKHALKLMDVNQGSSAWIASNQISEGKMKYLEVQSLLNLMVFGDAGSLTPSRASLRLENLISDYTSNLLLMSFHGRNMSHLVDRLLGSSALLDGKVLMERILQLEEPLSNLGLEQIAEKIGYVQRDEPTFEAFVFTRFMDFQHNQYRFDKNSAADILRSVDLRLSENGFDVSYNCVRTLMPLYVSLILPIDAGFNLNLMVQTSIQWALDLQTSLQSRRQSSQSNYQLDFYLKSHIATNTHAHIGVIVPPENIFLGVEYDTTFIATPLLSGEVEAKMQSNKCEIRFWPKADNKNDKTIMDFQTLPYTTIKNIFEFKSQDENSELIHAMKAKEYEIPVWGKTLAVDVKTEGFWDDRGSNVNYVTENSLNGFLSFWWMNEQFRIREYRLVRKSSALPQLNYKMRWEYEVAKSQPEKRFRNVWYMVWKAVAGWADIPVDCQYANQKQSQSQSRSSEESSNESSRTLLHEHTPFSRPQFNSKSNENDGSDEKYGDYGSSYSKTAQAYGANDNINIEEAKIGEGISSLKIISEATVKTDTTWGYSAELNAAQHHKDWKTTYGISISPIGNVPNKKICLVGSTTRTKPPCLFGRHTPDMRQAKIIKNAMLKYGNTCENPETSFDVKVVMKKSKEQTDSRRDFPWFYHQCRRDRNNGQPMSFACMQEWEHEALLNNVEVVVKYDKVSPQFYNRSKQLEELLMVTLYPYMSHNYEARNPPQQFKVVANYRYNIPAIDWRIEHPKQTYEFSRVYYGNHVPFVDVPSVSKSRVQRGLDYWSDNTLTPTCTFGNDYVSGFNNVTFNFTHPIGCQYLFSADCSGSNRFEVSVVRESQDNKTLIVRVLKTVIEINPNRRNDVIISGKSYSMKDGTELMITDKSTGPVLIATIVKDWGRYKVILTFIRMSVHFDGKHTQLITSNMWENPLCGICGQYGPLDSDLFEGPGKYLYTEGSDFAQTYKMPRTSCNVSPPLRGRKIKPAEAFRFLYGGCYTHGPVVRSLKDNITCISTTPATECNVFCVSEGDKPNLLDFHCVDDEGQDVLPELISAFRMGDLNSLPKKATRKTLLIHLPERCMRM